MEEKMSLSTYEFSRPHRGETEKLIIRSYVNNILPLCALSLVICITVGCILPSFSLELFGIVRVAVEFGQDFEEATVSHSVFSVIKLLFDQASYTTSCKSYQSSVGEREPNYDDSVDEKCSYRYFPRRQRSRSERVNSSTSLGKKSITSQMDSMEGTSKDEPFEAISYTSSFTSNFSSTQSSRSEARSSSRSPRSSQKAPQPPEYLLSRKSLKTPPPSYPSTIDNKATQRSQRNLKHPSTSSHSFTTDQPDLKQPPSSCSPPSPQRFTSRGDDYTRV